MLTNREGNIQFSSNVHHNHFDLFFCRLRFVLQFAFIIKCTFVTGDRQTVCSLAVRLMQSDDFGRDTGAVSSLFLYRPVPFALARNQLRFFTRWELEAAPYYK